MECPVCHKEVEFEDAWEEIGNEDLECPFCNASLRMNYEESYDALSGDEWLDFWLTKREND